jgi:hypothetical protein
MCSQCKENEWKLQIIGIFLSVKICSIVPKTELDLHVDIHVINLYTKFHFSMCNLCEENERKLGRLTDR